MGKKSLKRRDEARQTGIQRCDFAGSLVKRVLLKWKIDDDDRQRALGLLGVGSRPEMLLASDLAALMQASECLLNLIKVMIKQHPQRQYYFATFVDDLGNTGDRAPNLQISPFQNKVERAIRSLGLSGIIVNGFHPFMNHPGGGKGRQISVDAHGILWMDKPFDHAAAARVQNRSGTWFSSLTIKPIDIAPLDPKKLARLCYYLFKPWHEAKNVMSNKKNEGDYKLMSTRKGYRPEFATRLFEGLSQIELMKLVTGINGGTGLRQQLRKSLVDWHRSRPEPIAVPASVDVWLLWASMREENGSRDYKPFRFNLASSASTTLARRRPPRRRRLGNAPPRKIGQRHLGKPPSRAPRRNPLADL